MKRKILYIPVLEKNIRFDNWYIDRQCGYWLNSVKLLIDADIPILPSLNSDGTANEFLNEKN